MKSFVFVFGLSLAFGYVFGQSASITIKINGIEEAKGNMSIALYDNADDFPGKENYVKGEDIPVNALIFEYTFNDIPYGTYAIAVYHDIDKNGELNSNWLGMPKEPYGFSNNAKGRLGPPDYENASFQLAEDIEIEITLKD